MLRPEPMENALVVAKVQGKIKTLAKKLGAARPRYEVLPSAFCVFSPVLPPHPWPFLSLPTATNSDGFESEAKASKSSFRSGFSAHTRATQPTSLINGTHLSLGQIRPGLPSSSSLIRGNAGLPCYPLKPRYVVFCLLYGTIRAEINEHARLTACS